MAVCKYFVAAVLGVCAPLYAQTVTAIQNVRVFDGTGAPVQVMTVLLSDERISAVGPNVAVPSGAKIIDGKGKTLLPGFFDLHTHLNASGGPLAADWQKSTAAYLVCGVTTIDEFSANREMYAPLRKLMTDGTVIAPHINFATRISTPGGHGAEAGMGDFTTVEASTPLAAHEAMKRILPYHPDVIKIFTDGWRYGETPALSSMNEATIRAIVTDAHAAGLKVLTHTVTVEGAKAAAGGGVDVIAHSIQDAPVDQDLVKLMKANHTAYVPTLAVYEAGKPTVTTPLQLSVLEPAMRENVQQRVQSKKPDEDSPSRKRWIQMQANLRALFNAGIPVALGTDNGMPFTPHGWGTLHEMELLVAAGLTPSQALQAGTGISAVVLGVEKDRGTIAPGKAADLVLVNGRPDENIRDVENTDAVWLAGKQIDRTKLLMYFDSERLEPLPGSAPPALIDDMERADGRTSVDTLKYPTTDPGADHTQIILQQVIRPEGGHAWLATTKMGPDEKDYARLNVPLTPGEITLADVSKYQGIEFEAKGEGDFRLLLSANNIRNRHLPQRSFQVTSEWKKVTLQFSSFSTDSADPLDLKELKSFIFELGGAAGSKAWLQLDNIRLY